MLLHRNLWLTPRTPLRSRNFQAYAHSFIHPTAQSFYQNHSVVSSLEASSLPQLFEAPGAIAGATSQPWVHLPAVTPQLGKPQPITEAPGAMISRKVALAIAFSLFSVVLLDPEANLSKLSPNESCGY